MASLSPPAACPAPALLAAALGLGLPHAAAPASLFAALPFRINLPHEQTVMLWWHDDAHAVSLRAAGPDRWRIGGLPGIGEVSARRTSPHGLAIDLGGTLLPATVVAHSGTVEVRLAGQSWTLATMPPRKVVAGAAQAQVTAPMPGRVLSVDVTPGQVVAEGDRLLVLEAMKMEHRLTARTGGTVKAVHVATGDQVADGMMLVEFA
jgi:3-methylcrotonyl-CoA carboxylase alpha subunit